MLRPCDSRIVKFPDKTRGTAENERPVGNTFALRQNRTGTDDTAGTDIRLHGNAGTHADERAGADVYAVNHRVVSDKDIGLNT